MRVRGGAGRTVREVVFCGAALLLLLAVFWLLAEGRMWTGLIGMVLFWLCSWAAGEPRRGGEG
jgi:hypothetical protein